MSTNGLIAYVRQKGFTSYDRDESLAQSNSRAEAGAEAEAEAGAEAEAEAGTQLSYPVTPPDKLVLLNKSTVPKTTTS